MQLECTDRQTVHEGRTNAASNLPMTMPMMRCDVQLHKVALPPRESATEYDAERASGNLCRARLGLQLHVLPQLSLGPTGVSVACAFASLYKVNLQLYRSGWRLPKLPLASASFSTCTKYTSCRRVESRMDYLGVASHAMHAMHASLRRKLSLRQSTIYENCPIPLGGASDIQWGARDRVGGNTVLRVPAALGSG
jgi:hypothetical protein